jgi:hypothetical protein
VTGNELADRAAKEATGWAPNRRPRPPEDVPVQLGRVLISSIKTRLKRLLAKQWATEWSREKEGRQLYRLASTPAKQVLQLHRGQPKWKSALIIQLRTGKIGLNQFLFRRKVPGIESTGCPCNEGPHTPQHVLLTCHTHRDLRRQFNIRPGIPLGELLGQPELAKTAAEFIKATNILHQFAHI